MRFITTLNLAFLLGHPLYRRVWEWARARKICGDFKPILYELSL